MIGDLLFIGAFGLVLGFFTGRSVQRKRDAGIAWGHVHQYPEVLQVYRFDDTRNTALTIAKQIEEG